MTPEKLQPNLEEEPLSFEIHSPTQEDFETLHIEKLHALWKENHERLKMMLKIESPPYFGLHGTSQQNFQQIETEGSRYIEIATFYEKEYESEQFLYKLYHAALYVSMYANREQPGVVMVFNLEKNGKNISFPWEHLLPGNTMPNTLFYDSDEEKKHFSDLNQKLKGDPYQTDLLFRSDLSLQHENFNERFSGSINFSDDKLRKYVSNLEGYERIILRNRFLAQEIVSQILELLAKKRN